MRADQGSSTVLPNDPQEWPRAIRTRRKYLRLTQQELAGRADVSVSTVTRIENGRAGADPYTLRRILEALGFEPHPNEPYDGDDRRHGERRQTDPADAETIDINRLLSLPPKELAALLLRLPRDKAEHVLAAYHEGRAGQAGTA